ncbi:Serine/threonine-protein kinase [Coemansia sp. RSA 552]|nr:Serine/threonine-protein kinase [Coemansia sp. RSA 552]
MADSTSRESRGLGLAPSSSDGRLKSRLEFSINLEMLDNKPSLPSNASVAHSVKKTRPGGSVIRRLISRRNKPPREEPVQMTPIQHNSEVYHLQLPSPITSLCHDTLLPWDNNTMRIKDDVNNDDMALVSLIPLRDAPSPPNTPYNTIHNANYNAIHNANYNAIRNRARESSESLVNAAEQQRPTSPEPPAATHISASTDGLTTTKKDGPPPRRGRSLMFKPLLDVTAVGSLIDTISKTPEQKTPAKDPEPSASRRHRRSILRTLSTKKPTRPRAQTVKRLFRNVGGATTTLRPDVKPRPRSHHDIRPIDTLQDDTCSAPLAIPKQTQIRRAGTISVVPYSAAQNRRAASPGFQAAQAVMHKPPPPPPPPLPSDNAVLPGYTPIAVSLKGTRSRQFLLNTPLGEFEVLKTLGQGSYGKVKLMRSALSNEQFAVKIIKRYAPHKHKRGHNEFRKAKTLDRRVVREANLSAILGQLHPHIVPLHAFRVTDSHFYLFYAYVRGVTLAERIGAGGLKSESEARAIFKPVAETISFCHRYSVIHRDIKLENVLIDYSDVDDDEPRDTIADLEGRVRLIDFGLANFFDGSSPLDTFCGSLPYTAPEILRGDAYTGPEIDVWSLGVLLYVMLTGHFPFEDPAQPKNFDRIMAGDFPLPADTSRPLQELLVQMLEPSASRRLRMSQILQHRWLAPAVDAGVCCPQHPYQTIAHVHERRTLVLPGPTAHPLIAKEVATCLDCPVADVTRQVDDALGAGTPQRPPKQQQQRPGDEYQWNLLAPIHQWPPELCTLGWQMVEVANSPVVSVYALVLQQIGMRRYYLEMPQLESSSGTSSFHTAPQQSTESVFRRLGSGGPQPTTPPLDDLPDHADHTDRRPLAARFAARITGLIARIAPARGTRFSRQPPPAYTMPLSTGGASAPVLADGLRKAGGSRMASGSKKTKRWSRPLFSPLLSLKTPDPRAELVALRTLRAKDHAQDRIPMPSELSSLPAHHIIGLLSALLHLHEIAHTFVETQRMPVQRALDSSIFSLKTIAALINRQQEFNCQDVLDALNEYADPLLPTPSASLRSLVPSIFSRRGRTVPPPKPSIVHPHLYGERSGIPDIVTTMPVRYATPVILAQYSPSLSRCCESEIIEYYSCSVRIELVRLPIPHSLRSSHRHALLVDRMAGHKAKFSLFVTFLRRILPALSTLQPAPLHFNLPNTSVVTVA